MPSFTNAIYAGGFNSYFDVTPDLQFILGRDHMHPTLVHCLGAGQAFKYAPVLGEIVSDMVVHGSVQYAGINLDAFSIERFTPERTSLASTQQTDGHTL